MSNSDSVLFFFNADFTHLARFYTQWPHKTLKDSKICSVFMKNNTTVIRVNGECLQVSEFELVLRLWAIFCGCNAVVPSAQPGIEEYLFTDALLVG